MKERRFSRRDLFRLSALAGVGAAAAACAPAAEPQVVKETVIVRETVVVEVPKAAEGPIKLTVCTDWNDGPRKDFYDLMTEKFQAIHPEVTVEVWHMGSGGTSGPGGMADIVRAQILTDTAADVIQGNPAGSLDFAAKYLLTINDTAEEFGWDRTQFYYAPDQMYTPDGELKVLPLNESVSGWLYNKTMFEEAGVDEPNDDWTWNDMVEAAIALTNPDEQQYGVWAVGPGIWYGVGEHMWAAGATYWTKDKLRSGMCEARGPEVFEAWIDLIYGLQVSPKPGEVQALLGEGVTNLFATGRVGMFPYGVHNTGGLARQIGDRFEWSVMPTPKDPVTGIQTFQMNNDGNGVFYKAADRGTARYAVEYIMLMLGDEMQEFVARNAPSFPVNKKWANSEAFLAPPPLNKTQVLRNRDTYEPIPMMWHDHWGEANRAFRSEYDKAWTGEVPAKEALFAGCEAAAAVLERYKDEIVPWQFDWGFPLEGLSRKTSVWFEGA